jgi:hypothetical protein
MRGGLRKEGAYGFCGACLDIVERSPKKPRHHDRVAVDTGLS